MNNYTATCNHTWKNGYISFSIARRFGTETDYEFDQEGFGLESNIDSAARILRDHELLLDFFGCLDADCDAYAQRPANAEFNANAH